jgi:membrane fusion protein, multidrug efflux system
MANPVETELQIETERTPRIPEPRGYFNERPFAKWALIGGIIVVIVTLFSIWSYYSVRESTDDAEIDAHIDPISARVGGTVAAVKVLDNQQVRKGDVLVQIDPTDYQVALERAKADYAEAQAEARAAQTGVPITSTTSGSQLSSAQAGAEQAQASLGAAEKEVTAAEAKLTAAKAKLAQAQADSTKSSRDLDRYKQLIAKDEVSQQEYDAAVASATANVAAVESAKAEVAVAQQNVSVAQSHVTEAQAGVAQAQAGVRSARTAPQQVAAMQAKAQSAQARVEQAKAALDQAELNLGYATVKAPVDGMVSKKSVEIGQVIQGGQPLMAIVPLDEIWVTANFKETQLNHMKVGQPVIISVDTYGGREYHGTVQSIAAATGAKFSLLPPENATGNYVKVVQRIPVKILFDKGQDPNHLLRPGMSVEPTVITK